MGKVVEGHITSSWTRDCSVSISRDCWVSLFFLSISHFLSLLPPLWVSNCSSMFTLEVWLCPRTTIMGPACAVRRGGAARTNCWKCDEGTKGGETIFVTDMEAAFWIWSVWPGCNSPPLWWDGGGLALNVTLWLSEIPANLGWPLKHEDYHPRIVQVHCPFLWPWEGFLSLPLRSRFPCCFSRAW